MFGPCPAELAGSWGDRGGPARAVSHGGGPLPWSPYEVLLSTVSVICDQARSKTFEWKIPEISNSWILNRPQF